VASEWIKELVCDHPRSLPAKRNNIHHTRASTDALHYSIDNVVPKVEKFDHQT
jgi:hypothetical protein